MDLRPIICAALASLGAACTTTTTTTVTNDGASTITNERSSKKSPRPTCVTVLAPAPIWPPGTTAMASWR